MFHLKPVSRFELGAVDEALAKYKRQTFKNPHVLSSRLSGGGG